MGDPFGSIQNMIGQFQGFMQNPLQFMASKRLNIPANMMNDPNQAIQYMLNNGMISQSQYDWAVRQANQIQKMPQFKQFFGQNNGQNH